MFSDKLIKLLTHSFIALNQSNFFKETKENLKEGPFAVICDFAENYKFVLQDEIQSFHWNNSQATILPFAIYYKSENKLSPPALSSYLTVAITMQFLFIYSLKE